ncbi:MAG: SusC/RagA family TonB-linked outer membrane protein [Ginsengibacter sp.]
MKLNTILLLVTCLQVSAKNYQEVVTMELNNTTLENVFKEVPETEVPEKPSAPLLIQVKGHVINETGESLAGASVKIKGTQTGVSSDAQGNFEIQVSDGGGVLIISYVGYITQEIKINSSSTLSIILKTEPKTDEEIVVATALGVKRNLKSLTYSTQTVNPKQLTEAREINILTSLQGKIAGMSITTSGSGIGGEVRVVLRGNRSIDGDSQPLYIIDGVPVSGSPSDLSPDNIASINVLKGANAAALYGSDAQNGAVIIETKKGTSGTHVSLSQTYMVQEPYKLLPFQNVYGQGYSGIYSGNAEAAWGPKMTGQMVDTWSLNPEDAGKQYPFLPNPNNKIDVFQKGNNMATNIIANMGGEKVQAVFSYTYTSGKGILPNNDLDRNNISMRINSKLTSRLSLDSKIEYMQQKIENITSEGSGNLNPLYQIYTMPSNIRTTDLRKYEFLDAEGNKRQNWWNPSSQDGENPYWVLNRDLNSNSKRRALVMTSLTYSFSKEINLMVRASYDGSNGTFNRKWSNGTYNVAAFGMYWEGQQQNMYMNNDFLLSYNPKINSNWSVKLNAGGNMAKFRNSSLVSNTGDALLAPNLFAMSNTNMPVTSFDPGARYNKNALYAFSTIAWKNSVFLDITGRNDWSSTLPENSRSYFYPSVGLSAVLSDLIPSLPKTISFAKVRVSLANVGNDTRPYMFQRTANFIAGGTNGFLALSSLLPNPNLVPEMSKSTEIGLDLRLFNNRVGIDFTAYETDTKNQIFALSLPVGSGASSYFTNGGNVQNKGIEIVVSSTPIKTADFNWDLNLNFASNKSKVTKISDEISKLTLESDDSYFKDFVIEAGAPFGQLYGRGWQRDDKGRVIVGSDGIPLLTEGKTVFLANFNPKWTGGLLNSFSYKNFSISFVIEHKQGGTMVSQSNAVIDALGLSERTIQGREGGLVFGENFFSKETAVLENGTHNNISLKSQDFWTTVGGLNNPVGEPFVVSCTNTRLREATIGYSLPKSVFSSLHLSDVKISLVGRNLFFISRASLYADPDIMPGTEKIYDGFQSFNPPSSRYYGLNLKIGF